LKFCKIFVLSDVLPSSVNIIFGSSLCNFHSPISLPAIFLPTPL
jgi:hypothetical protein